jgi:RNA polymerase sigma factor (sigma-70 family)
MTGFDGTSDIRQLLDDPTFRAQLDQACKSAFKKYTHPPYDSWADLENDVVLKLLTSEAFFIQYREVTNAKGYLYQIASNVLISKFRRHRRIDGKTTGLEDLDARPSDLTADQDEIEIRILLNELSNEILPLLKPNERAVVDWYWDDKPFADMAREQKVTPATISKRFAKAIKKIQRLVRARDFGRKT